MEQPAAETTTIRTRPIRTRPIRTRPIGIRWCGVVGHVLFGKPTRCVYTVQGMTIKSGKGALNLYNRKFARRRFVISLNAGGKGIHFCEGIQWDDSTKTWIEIPMPQKQIWLEAEGAFETPFKLLYDHIWNVQNSTWLAKEMDVNFPLFRQTGTEFPLNCWEHRLSENPCHCNGVDEMRKQFDNYEFYVDDSFCPDCGDWYSGEACPICPFFYIRKSLHGLYPFCSVCQDQNNLDKCVAVRAGVQTGMCTHSFHEHCISKWFADGNTTCPICRYVHDLSNQTFNIGDSVDGDSVDGDRDDGDSDYSDDTYDVDDGCDCPQCSFYRGRH
jgi:hypothetical protein